MKKQKWSPYYEGNFGSEEISTVSGLGDMWFRKSKDVKNSVSLLSTKKMCPEEYFNVFGDELDHSPFGFTPNKYKKVAQKSNFQLKIPHSYKIQIDTKHFH